MILPKTAALFLVATALLAACGNGNTDTSASESAATTSETTATSESTAGSEAEGSESAAASTSEFVASKAEGKTSYPLKMDSCGRALTFDKAPEKVVSVGFGSLPTIVDLGLDDRIVGISQTVPENTYPKDLEARLKAMPRLNTANSGSGHAQVSTEAILAEDANMTMSPDRDLDFEALATAGVQNYSQPGYCKNKTPEPAKIDDIYTAIDEIAEIFDVPSKAEDVKAELKDRIDAAKANEGTDNGTAAVVFVTPGETELWTYGKASMTNVVLETAGLKNVYGDSGERVFKLNLEDLLSKDPDRLILLYVGDDAKAVEDAFASNATTSELKAVKDKKVKTMPYAWADPATSLVVDGIEEVGSWVKETK